MDLFSQFGGGQKKEKVPRKKAVKELWNKLFYGAAIAGTLLVLPNLAPTVSPHVEKATDKVKSITGDGMDGVTSFFGHYLKKIESSFQDGLVYLFS
eukprot:gene5541-9361_t